MKAFGTDEGLLLSVDNRTGVLHWVGPFDLHADWPYTSADDGEPLK